MKNVISSLTTQPQNPSNSLVWLQSSAAGSSQSFKMHSIRWLNNKTGEEVYFCGSNTGLEIRRSRFYSQLCHQLEKNPNLKFNPTISSISLQKPFQFLQLSLKVFCIFNRKITEEIFANAKWSKIQSQTPRNEISLKYFFKFFPLVLSL